MAQHAIGVKFKSAYDSNIASHLEDEKKRLMDLQRWINDRPFTLAFRIDINGIKAQVAQIHQTMAAELNKAGGATILGPDGRSAAASVKELSKVKGLLQEISTTTFAINDKGQLVQTGEFLKQVEQLGNGMERISRYKKDKAGDWQILSKSEKDVRTVKQLEDGLRAVNKELGREFGAARGRGDRQGQLEALRKQKAEVDRLVSEAAKGGLIGSSAYTRAESQQDRLAARISGMEGSVISDAEKKSRAARKLEVEKAIKSEEARATAALKANKLEMDQAERHLPDRVKYEAELNRLYQERRRIFEQSKAAFQQMDNDLQGEGRPDLANKAFNRGLNAQSQVNQSDLDHSRAVTDNRRRGQKEAESQGQKQLRADVDFQRKKQAELESQNQKQLRADVEAGQKRLREKAAREREARESAFRQELQDIKAQSERRINEINRAEQREIAAAKSAAAKQFARQKAHSLRQSEYGNLAGSYVGVEQRMRAGGFISMADSTRGKALSATSAAAKDMERFEQASKRSGHALNFHSSSLLRNAGTFLRWQIPMRAVMSLQQAFMAGVQNAIRVDRQFATLQTVFNGTAQEARALKAETLDLAIAQGRSAEEAMDSSIRWSRLGMTRLQVLEATRVSLVAANVAEISAADAAEKLSGIYATYKLSVGDLADTLNRLNSISNNYNVTVKDLFEGIARVSGVAKQSGLELRDLEGIIGAVTGATGRPGQEIGNALKMVITRLGDPKIGEKLKKEFDIDLTGANGDLKNMSQILRELSDIYPTLNKAEQQRFLMLTAGSRQASRMAQVMTEYRQAQILTAQAAMDHGASERENEKILGSLQSRIDALAASWTNLATAFGDAGGFERAGQFMRYLQQIVTGLSGSIDELEQKTSSMTINNPVFAEAVEKLGGGEDKWFGTRSKFDRKEIENTLGALTDAKAKMGHGSQGMLEKVQEMLGFDKKIHVGGDLNGMGLSGPEIDKAIKFFQGVLESGGDTGMVDKIRVTTKEVSDLRNEVEGLETARWTFDSLAKAVAEGGVDRKVMVRDFQAMASLLLALPEGQNVYNDAMREFNRLASEGDVDNIATLLEKLSRLFAKAGGPKVDALRQAMSQTTKVLDAQVAELEARKAKAMEEKPGKERDERISKINDDLKNLRDSIAQVNGAVEGLDQSQESAFGVTGSRRINNYLSDVLAAAKAIGEAFKDFVPDAENDPVERTMQRHRRMLDLGREALVNIQRETNRESSANRSKAHEISDPEQRRRVIDQQNEADEKIKSTIANEDERLENLRRELDYEEAILKLKRQQSDASKQAATSSSAWRFGEFDSSKDANQARFAIARAKAGIDQAGGEWLLGQDTPQSRAKNAGQVLQDEATARGALESMQRRNYEIDAARKQIAYDLLKAEKDQTHEASKRYQLASREDQLRASILARTIRDKGGLSHDEFSMLSQSSRQAVVNYLPSQAPGILNEAKSSAATRRKELDDEKTQLRQSIEDVRISLKSLADSVTQNVGKGGLIDPLKDGLPGRPLQNATQDQNPVINLNLGAINLQMKLADGISSLVEAALLPKVKAELSAIEARLRSQKIPNPQGVVE